MGIEVEFNPDLALRAYGTEGRLEEECLPKELVKNCVYPFLKEGQRNYFFHGPIALLETYKGDSVKTLENNLNKLSRPIAAIRILEATHYLDQDRGVMTVGTYRVLDVFDITDPKINFEWMERVNDSSE